MTKERRINCSGWLTRDVDDVEGDPVPGMHHVGAPARVVQLERRRGRARRPLPEIGLASLGPADAVLQQLRDFLLCARDGVAMSWSNRRGARGGAGGTRGERRIYAKERRSPPSAPRGLEPGARTIAGSMIQPGPRAPVASPDEPRDRESQHCISRARRGPHPSWRRCVWAAHPPLPAAGSPGRRSSPLLPLRGRGGLLRCVATQPSAAGYVWGGARPGRHGVFAGRTARLPSPTGPRAARPTPRRIFSAKFSFLRRSISSFSCCSSLPVCVDTPFSADRTTTPLGPARLPRAHEGAGRALHAPTALMAGRAGSRHGRGRAGGRQPPEGRGHPHGPKEAPQFQLRCETSAGM